MDKLITSLITSSQAPLVLEPADKKMPFSELLTLLREDNDFFKAQLRKHGALLLRNFPITNEHDFSAVIEGLRTGEFINYIGGDSPRTIITKGVYTSTETPPSMHLPLHNELSYVKHYPSHIYFYCAIPPAAKGETIIGDARKIYQAINPEVREKFEEKKLLYVSRYPSKKDWMYRVNNKHKSWVHVFETEDKKEVEKKCMENEIDFKWNQNDWLQIRQTRPAVISHPQTHEPVWFNQAHHFDFNPRFLGWWRYLATKAYYCRRHTLLHEVSFADNTPISRDDLYHIYDVMDTHTTYFPWQKNDVLVLDNILMMHGRASFKGKRRVLTAMTGE